MTVSARRELADFLGSRRRQLSPGAVGLPAGTNRRTPGLRREEVALLAGVSHTWYTWLEQGRDIHPSRQVIDALARTFLGREGAWDDGVADTAVAFCLGGLLATRRGGSASS